MLCVLEIIMGELGPFCYKDITLIKIITKLLLSYHTHLFNRMINCNSSFGQGMYISSKYLL